VPQPNVRTHLTRKQWYGGSGALLNPSPPPRSGTAGGGIGRRGRLQVLVYLAGQAPPPSGLLRTKAFSVAIAVAASVPPTQIGLDSQ
jgi:hypothetical protein